MEVDETIKQTAHELLEETRTTMEEVAAKMLFIKKEGRPKSELRELITQMSLRFITLRQVNRSILMEEDRIKAETEAAKGPIDTTTLQLHNLMYEKNHYLKAIKACKDFRSKYPDIELVPEEEFFSSAPQDIKGKVLANDGAHDLMLKRLNFELFQRKELCKLHEKLEQHKASLLDTISNRKKFLSSLPSHLKSLKKASLPVQQQLGNFHTKKLKQHHAAELLPPTLYIVYSQLLAQKEAFGEKIEMEILGSIKDAQTFVLQKVSKEKGLSNPDNNRLEDDAPDEEEDGQRRRKRPKKNLVKDSIEQSGVFQLHPLKIILHIYDDEDSGAKPSKLITLKFEYLVKLNAVCVGIEDTEEGPDTDILCNLFPDDTGLELPHQMAKLYSGDSLAFSERKNSRPYKWAQHLAGIDFLPEVPPILSNGATLNAENSKVTDISFGLALYRHENRVQTILQRIRSRKKAQMGLVEQLDSLMKLKWPLLTYENVLWASHTPLCTLQNWSPAGLVPDSSSLSAVMVGQASNNLDVDLDRRSVTSWDVENAREDGELPTALPVPPLPVDSSVTLSNEPDHSRSMALISKNVTPSKMVKTRSFSKYEDDLDFLLDSESEVEEQACVDELNESVTCIVGRPWEDCAAREFDFVLGRTCENDHIDHIGKLNAKVKISIEYPLRPPIFSLSTDSGHSKWYNVLRAMEAEVNLHILKVLPLDYENNMLAHQVRCLAMLFDFNFGLRDEQRKSTSIIDVGLCKPVSGTILARSVRGRDHRKMISWNSVGCIPDYPS